MCHSFYPNISSINDIQGFAYCYKTNKDKIYVLNDWQEKCGYLKTPTVLEYDENNEVLAWGYEALAKPPSPSDKKKKKKKVQVGNTKIAEKFKLHLCKIEEKPYLPKGLDYKTAIIDYLKQIRNAMEKALTRRYQKINIHEQVSIVMTVNLFSFFKFLLKQLKQGAFLPKILLYYYVILL
jgi:hypothetical protein